MEKLLELEKKEKQIEYQIKQRKYFLHKEFYHPNKVQFWLLDILFVLGILFNFGALTMTNMVLSEQAELKAELEGRTTTLVEMNPVIADTHNLPKASKEEISSFWKMVLYQLASWIIWLYSYIYFRRRCFTRDSLTLLTISVVIFVFTTGLNFFSDLGYFI